jgi:hypothetical protein
MARHWIVDAGLDATSAEFRSQRVTSGDTHDEEVIDVTGRGSHSGEPHPCPVERLAIMRGQRDTPPIPFLKKRKLPREQNRLKSVQTAVRADIVMLIVGGAAGPPVVRQGTYAIG